MRRSLVGVIADVSFQIADVSQALCYIGVASGWGLSRALQPVNLFTEFFERVSIA